MNYFTRSIQGMDLEPKIKRVNVLDEDIDLLKGKTLISLNWDSDLHRVCLRTFNFVLNDVFYRLIIEPINISDSKLETEESVFKVTLYKVVREPKSDAIYLKSVPIYSVNITVNNSLTNIFITKEDVPKAGHVSILIDIGTMDCYIVSGKYAENRKRIQDIAKVNGSWLSKTLRGRCNIVKDRIEHIFPNYEIRTSLTSKIGS